MFSLFLSDEIIVCDDNNEFKCWSDGKLQCLPISKRCNLDKDCNDGEDESKAAWLSCLGGDGLSWLSNTQVYTLDSRFVWSVIYSTLELERQSVLVRAFF